MFLSAVVVAVLFTIVLPVTPSAQALADPVADAGPDQTVQVGTIVVFNGSGSHSDVPITNYTWSFTYYRLNIRLYGMVNGTFNFTDKGIFNVTLKVNDTNGVSATDWCVIKVNAKPLSASEILSSNRWYILGLSVAVIISVVLWLVSTGRVSWVPESTQEKTRLSITRFRKVLKQILVNRMGLAGMIILIFFGLMAVLGPVLAPYSLNDQFGPYMRQSSDHWMGTDAFSTDIFTELLYGARISLLVGVVSAVIASGLGAAVGLYSGYVGGWKDEVVMRVNDVVLSIPWLVLMIIVAALLGKINLTGIILIIGLTGWSFTARMVRAQVLSIKERQYVERARAIGSSDLAIIRRHIFPNTFPLVFANTILTVAVSILSEATLSFLGLRPQGAVTWGTMLSYASGAGAFQLHLHWWIVAPGLCIVFIVLGFTLLGYALDDILNPKLRRR